MRWSRAAFSPDGTMVLTASRDNTAELWSVSTTEPLGSPLVHEGPVEAVAFSPDRATVATGSADGTVRFWDIATGRPLGPALRHGGPVAALAFCPDGRLITGSRDGKAQSGTPCGRSNPRRSDRPSGFRLCAGWS